MPISTKVKNSNTTTTDSPFEDGESYFGRVVQVVDLGLQPGGEYQGQPKPDKEQILVTFEFPEVIINEQPAWLSVFLSLPDRWDDGNFKGIHLKSNLYKYLNILLPEGLYTGGKNPNYVSFQFNFDWEMLLGKPIQCTIGFNDKGKPKITESTKVPKKFLNSVPELVSAPVCIDMGSEPDQETWLAVPSWIRKIIEGSLDESVANLAEKLNSNNEQEQKKPQKNKKAVEESSDFDDDIPF